MSGAANTSILAFHSLEAPELGQRQAIILQALSEVGPMSNRALARRLRLPINSVTPRVKELREMGLVTEAYTDLDLETGVTVSIWKAVL